MNGICSYLITMVPKWNYFIFIQIDCPRWPPGTVTKNSINKKIIISQDQLVEIEPTLCQNVSGMNRLYFFAVWHSKMAAVTKNSTEHENDNILHGVVTKLNRNRPDKFASMSKNCKV